jgi:hypothetical protein
MKLKLQFGLNEPAREVNWWQQVTDFPHLVLYKNKKWQFEMYGPDQTNQVDQICYFSEVASYDPNWYATTYQDISGWLDNGYGAKCECGAIYTSFPQAHMFFCPKWSKWS